jgi:hypothetical protein
MLGMAARMVDAVVCVSAGQAAWLEQAAGLRGVVIHPHVANPGLADLPPRVAGAAAHRRLWPLLRAEGL